jgi:hypothetical protein
MRATIRKVTVWHKEIDNHSGALAELLKPLAEAGADLQAVIAYRLPGDDTKALVEACPVSGRKTTQAAQVTGLAPASAPILLVQGDNRPGLGHVIAKALGDAGINLSFLVAQVVDGKYAAAVRFENDADASRALGVLRKAVASRLGKRW